MLENYLPVLIFLMVATLPGRTQGLGLITEPLLSGLRLDRNEGKYCPSVSTPDAVPLTAAPS